MKKINQNKNSGGRQMSKYNFTLKETDGRDISLNDYKGKNLVVYFYPKDNTPG